MNIIEKIKVGGIIYDVEIFDEIDDGNAAGEIITEKQLIKLAKGKEDFMNSSFLHEILHAINIEIKESDIEFMAQALYQIIKDNPALFKAGDQDVS